VLQNPARKPGVALVLKGRKGVGKDTLAEIMRRIVGQRHVAHVTSTDRLTSRFNAPFATALIGHVEEASWGGNKETKGVLQSLITSPVMPLERKGVDTVEVASYLRLIFTTNEDWAVPATADERRYAVFAVPDHRKCDEPYWNALYAQIEGDGPAGFMSFLLDWQKPDSVSLRRPPNTAALAEQKLAGLRGVNAWWLGVLDDGKLPGLDDIDDFDWAEAPQTIEVKDLYASYAEWMKDQKWHGETIGPRQFGKDIRRMCRGVARYRAGGGDTRPWHYLFPALDECRRDFNKAMDIPDGTVVWND